jgi:hypothetical protein
VILALFQAIFLIAMRGAHGGTAKKTVLHPITPLIFAALHT